MEIKFERDCDNRHSQNAAAHGDQRVFFARASLCGR
jgi:hypothetical protein